MKKYWSLGAAALLTLTLAACGSSEEGSKNSASSEVKTEE